MRAFYAGTCDKNDSFLLSLFAEETFFSRLQNPGTADQYCG